MKIILKLSLTLLNFGGDVSNILELWVVILIFLGNNSPTLGSFPCDIMRYGKTHIQKSQ